ncbi:kelch repeat protein [Ceratocystis lukuohia]|uniref:Kelch repeat protein n=1 Tax=Ceratocystis lukuohia TaxID=2019550 RepID=A0ABR4MQ52_9PEZI
MFTLSLNTSVNFTTANISDILDTFSKARGGSGNAAADGAPNYYSGALLGNNAEFFLYGGLARRTSAYPLPGEDEILGYQKFEYGAERDFTANLNSYNTDSGTNRYVTHGAGATVNSEWKAFYFSGLRSSAGPIDRLVTNSSATSWNIPADFLITLETDESNQLTHKWTNSSLPDDIKGRAAGEFVFVPVGENGIMVAVGGVTYPEFTNPLGESLEPDLSTSEGRGFHETIDIYDIGSKKWYRQNSTLIDTPPTLAYGCAVMGAASDGSSYNIYYYGGYTALSKTSQYSDDVWVLSLPSFTWTKIYSGNNIHGRVGHQCFQPYPGQLMIIGGKPGTTSSTSEANEKSCLEGNIIQLFNMSSLEWVDAYDPAKQTNYTIPDEVSNVIGGNAFGGATRTAPASGWSDDELEKLFDTAYPTSKITNYYPYSAAVGTGEPEPTSIGSGSSSDISNGAIAAIVVCSVLALSFMLGLFIWWRRRRLAQISETGTSATYTSNRIWAWILGTPPLTTTTTAAKAMTETTEVSGILPEGSLSPVSAMSVPVVVPVFHHEMDASVLSELEDTSRPELGETGMTPVKTTERKFPKTANIPRSPLSMSPTGLSENDRNSFISQSEISSARNSAMPPQTPSPPQSPTIPDMAAPLHPAAVPRTVSDVSNISDREARHLRHISDVSSTGDLPETPIISPLKAAFKEPVIEEQPEKEKTLPESSEAAAKDFSEENVAVAKTPYTSSARRSVFHESRDDLGEIEPPKKSFSEEKKTEGNE